MATSEKRQALLNAIEAAALTWDMPSAVKGQSIPVLIIHADHAKALVDAAKIVLAIIDRATEVPSMAADLKETT